MLEHKKKQNKRGLSRIDPFRAKAKSLAEEGGQKKLKGWKNCTRGDGAYLMSVGVGG